MEGFFSPVPKAGGGGGGGGAEAPPLWVQVKQEKAECLVALSELPAREYKAKHGSDLVVLKELNPVKGFILQPRELCAPAKATSILLSRDPPASTPVCGKSWATSAAQQAQLGWSCALRMVAIRR